MLHERGVKGRQPDLKKAKAEAYQSEGCYAYYH
jgi:hypothetical protein